MSTAEKEWVSQKVGQVALPRLRKVRLSKGVGVRELARRAGISKTIVVMLERGHGHTTYGRIAVAIADALDVDILELMAPKGLSDEEVEELRRVLAGGKPEAFGRGEVEDEEDEDLDAT
jgi:transcriptional regulator with XRE-family HTH domain